MENLKKSLKKLLKNLKPEFRFQLKYETFGFLFLMLLFPVYKFIIVNPHLIWKIDKGDISKTVYDRFYKEKIGELKKKYFMHDHDLHFYSNDSTIESVYKISPDMIVSDGKGDPGLAVYNQNGDKISFFHRKNGISWTKKTYSYPFTTYNRNIIFLITGENGGYATVDMQGEDISEHVSSGMFLTSFDISSHTNQIIIGYSNGYIKLFDKKLKEKWFKKFLESKYQLVKTVSASSRGNYFACLSGLDPEYITIMDRHGATVNQFLTSEGRRRPIALQFSMDEKYLLEESEKGIRLYSINRKKMVLSKKLFNSHNKRRMISMDLSCDGEYIIVAYKINDTISAVELLDRKGTLYFRLFFENEKPFVRFSFNKYNFQIETKNKIYLYTI
ncbi:MAG: hypothetical protein KKH98_01765 [Spirochaetes bacterium]|nr:hypothetical protein [Spirochaetota bacterium]